MGYLYDMYGKQTPDFIAGVKAGVEMFAVWKDGEQLCGIEKILLREVNEEIDRELGYPPEMERKQPNKPMCKKCEKEIRLCGEFWFHKVFDPSHRAEPGGKGG